MFYEIKEQKNTGRYYVRDMKTNRVFCVEAIRERDEKENDTAFFNGGIGGMESKNKSQVKGGAVLESDSVITKENGFKTIRYGSNPMDIIESLLRESPNGPESQGVTAERVSA